VTKEADNNGPLSHSVALSLDNSLPSFQEYTPERGEYNSSVYLACLFGLAYPKPTKQFANILYLKLGGANEDA